MSIFRTLLPDGVLVAEADPREIEYAALHREEAILVANAVEQRRREFAAGRLLVSALLKSLGHQRPLGALPDGRPDWPKGIAGSITHCRSLAAVAICRDDSCHSIGIDVEPDAPLTERVARKIVVAEERAWVEMWPDGIGAAALRVFCAKEAVFKAVYPLALKQFGFGDVALVPSPDGSGFTARLDVSAPPFARGTILAGRWRARNGHFGAAVAIGSV